MKFKYFTLSNIRTLQILFLLSFTFTTSSAINNVTNKDHWPSLTRVLNEYTWPAQFRVMDSIDEILSHPSVFKLSHRCKLSLANFANGLMKNREDAFKLLDSWSKSKPGLFSGEYADFGHWDQCIETVLSESSPGKKVTGRYCLYHLSWPLHTSHEEDMAAVHRHKSSWIKHLIADSDAFRFAKVAGATCIPSTCSRNELQSIADSFTERHKIPLRIQVEEKCDTIDDFNVPYSRTPIYKQICGYTLIVLVLFVITSTTLVYFKPNFSSNLFIKSFDARYNTTKLNYPILDPRQQELTYIHGLRTLYLAVCIYAHFVFVSGMANSETHMGLTHFQGPSNPILSGLTQMSGLLVSWNVVVGAALHFFICQPVFKEAKGQISFSFYLIYRVLRSTPVMIGTLMLILAYPPSWGSGPIFRKSYTRLTENCLNSWWMELLYIGNQRKAMDSCIVHGWYIASDLHMYAMAFVLIKAFQRSTKLGVTFCSIGILIGMLAQGFVTWYYNTGMSFAFTVQKIHVSIDETHLLHFATLNYISSYCIGIVVGYVILNKIRVEKKYYFIGWTICLLLAVGTTYWHDFMFKQLQPTRFQIVLTAALLRTIMALIGAWFIYSMWLGIPLLTSFFSNHWFLVLGRINFSTFMVHMLLIWHNDFHLHHPLEYRAFPLMCRWMAEIFFAHILGYLMYLTIEAPFNNLTRLYIFRSKKGGDANNNCCSGEKKVN